MQQINLKNSSYAITRPYYYLFQKYEDLPVGESFILQNDHDPKPLYYQFTAEKGKEFGWEYLQQGPEVWEVKISKLKL